MKYPEKESVTVELKRQFPDKDKFIKSVIAFCNQKGGKLVIGVDDDGTVIGVPEREIDLLLEKIEKIVFDACSPPIMVAPYVQRLGELAILCIEVGAGMSKPYFKISEGREKGTYIRIGRNSLRATPEILKELEWQSQGINFEVSPVVGSQIGDLDKSKLRDFLRHKQGVVAKFSSKVLESYQLIRKEQLQEFPTVAGLLLFGKEPQRFIPEAMMICSHFKGDEGRDVLNTIDCYGTLIEQFESSFEFVTARLGKSYRWDGYRRIDQLEIPPVALREVLLNALVHRNYHIQSPIKVAIYNSRVEIFSPGTFPGPLTAVEAVSGMSYLRNSCLARVFREYGLMEKLGTGFPTIFRAMKEHGLKEPVIFDGGDFVKVVLYRIPAVLESELDDDENSIMALLEQQATVTLKELDSALDISRATIARRLDDLISRGLVKREGRTRSTRFRKVRSTGILPVYPTTYNNFANSSLKCLIRSSPF